MTTLLPQDTIRPAGAGSRQPVITTLQIGESWFSERPTGLNRYYAGLLEHLPAAGVNVSGMVAAATTDALPAYVAAFAPPDASMFTRLRAVRGAAPLIGTTRPDVLVSHLALYTFPLLARLKGVPLVVHFHGPWAAESAAEGGGRLSVPAKRWLEGRVYRRAARVIVLSNAFKDVVCKTYGVEAARVVVIPGGVDVERFDSPLSKAAARAAFGWPLDRPVVLAVRRLVNRTGLEQLIQAAVRLRETVPGVLIILAGKGPLEAGLRARAQDLGLSDTVLFAGFVSDERLPVAYRAADVSVLPSVSLEGFGLSAAESLAAGTPVVVTPVGGLPEVVAPLDDRLIARDALAGGLHDALAAALASPNNRPSAQACRQFAAAHFDWPRVAARVAAVYRAALAGAPGRRETPADRNFQNGSGT